MAKEMTEEQKNELLESEDAMLEMMLQSVDELQNEPVYKNIEIRRKGKKYFSFEIRGLSDREVQKSRERFTQMLPNPRGRNYPKIEGKTDFIGMRDYQIYLATKGEIGKKIWDNEVLKDKCNVIEGWMVIAKVMNPAELDRVFGEISNLSGYSEDEEPVEDTLKN